MTPCTVYYFLSRRVQNGIVKGVCFMSEFSYMTEFRPLIEWSYFFCEAVFGNCGFLAPLAVGQRAYVMVRCPSCVRPSVRPSVH